MMNDNNYLDPNRNEENNMSPINSEHNEDYIYREILVYDDLMENRLMSLTNKMQLLYNDIDCRNSLKAWSILFGEYQSKDDFRNIEYLGKLINYILSFDYLAGIIKHYIYELIFVENNSPEYNMLKKKFNDSIISFDSLVTNYDIPTSVIEKVLEGASKREIKRAWGKENPKRLRANGRSKSDISKKKGAINYTKDGLIVLFILFVIIRILLKINTVTNKISPSKYTIMPTIEVTYNYIDILKRFSMNHPFSIDLNSDGIDDGIYYDNQSNCVMVEIYNKNSKKMEQWETLVDYVKEHPEAKNNDEVSKFLIN